MQERHYLPSPEQSTLPASRPLSWVASLAAVVGTAALTLLSVGCPEPADLDNPEMYPKRGGDTGASGSATGGSATGGSSTGGSGTGGSGNLAACETSCMTTVLATCTACHGSALKFGMLDLSAGYTARLKDQPATHSEIAGSPTCPQGDKLIDSANKAESWLLKKVSSQQGNCGDPMPAPSGLAGADLQCVQAYVDCVAAGGM